ncbi:MAG: hypothetical protein AMJ78_01660 [Omnitrophica WOR_2 bacterium SM23_29]|nr:MAG: hypothetical protein AMJ78_01660 [Omnitrophica WOR_2 bacterium SM23_29]
MRRTSPGALLFLLIIIINIIIYNGSFSHIFRHDDWNYWYHTRGEPFGLRYFLKFYSDESFSLDPILSIAFRPMALIFLGIQKFIFGSNYIYFHIFTFLLHVAILYMLLKILLEISDSYLAYLFVLVFSALSTGFDLVIWTNNNFYLLQILLMLVSVYLAILYKRRHPNNNGLLATMVFLQLPIVLLNEVGLFFAAFLSIFILLYRKRGRILKVDYYKSLYFLIPVLVFLILYVIHRLYGFSYAVKGIGYRTFFNAEVLFYSLVSALFAVGNFTTLIFFPSMLTTWFYDTVWFYLDLSKLDVVGLLLGSASVLLLLNTLSLRKIKENRIIILFLLPLILVYLYIASIGRVVTSPVKYVGSVCRFAYIFNVFFCIIVYCLIDQKKISKMLKGAGVILMLILTLFHSNIIMRDIGHISSLLAPLKSYFDQVYDFVDSKKTEKDFSFNVVSPPPKITFASWWGEGYKHCIEGHFYKYLNFENPKYILKYDYKKQIFTVYTLKLPKGGSR